MDENNEKLPSARQCVVIIMYTWLFFFLFSLNRFFSCEEWRRGSFNIYLVYVENISKQQIPWKGKKNHRKRKSIHLLTYYFPNVKRLV